METKSFWDIIKGGFTGIDNEGSAKRMTAFYVTIILITFLDTIYAVGFTKALWAKVPNDLDKLVVDSFTSLIYAHIIFVCLLLAVATIEGITNMIATAKGTKTNGATN